MQAINLLPWRMQQHKIRLRYWLYQVLILMALILLGYVLFFQVQDRLKQQSQHYQTQLEQIQNQQRETNEQLKDLRQYYVLTHRQPLHLNRLSQILSLLHHLPLQQGELSAVSLDPEKLWLSGEVGTQSEFEQVHKILSETAFFRQVKLSEFQPRSQHILFQFELPLKAE